MILKNNLNLFIKPVIAVICLFFCFFIGIQQVAAYDMENLKCGPKKEGKKYAVFVVSENDETTGYLEGHDPKDGKLYCLLVDEKATEATFDDFMTAGFFYSYMSDYDANMEWWDGCMYGWKEEYTFDKPASNILYLLSKTIENVCYGTGQERQDRIRYRVQMPDDRWLYFMGFSNNYSTEVKILDTDLAVCKDISKEKCAERIESCFWFKEKCWHKKDTKVCSEGLPKDKCGKVDGSYPGSYVCVWNPNLEKCQSPLDAGIYQQYQTPGGYKESGGVIPDCAFSGQCRDANDIVQVIVNFGLFMFGGIASFAFAFFVYGGFVWILSAGNPEKVKKGRDIMVAAVLGMLIVLFAYIAVDYLLEVLKVEGGFRGITR